MENRKTDDELRADLREIDTGDRDVNSWEAGFIERVVYQYRGPLTNKQRAIAIKIIEEYGDA